MMVIDGGDSDGGDGDGEDGDCGGGDGDDDGDGDGGDGGDGEDGDCDGGDGDNKGDHGGDGDVQRGLHANLRAGDEGLVRGAKGRAANTGPRHTGQKLLLSLTWG